MLEAFSGEERVLSSADELVREEVADAFNIENTYPPEYLNSLQSGSMPPSQLHLKIGCPIMILRNLAPAKGVCNGTQAVVTCMHNKVLEVRLLTGDHVKLTCHAQYLSFY